MLRKTLNIVQHSLELLAVAPEFGSSRRSVHVFLMRLQFLVHPVVNTPLREEVALHLIGMSAFLSSPLEAAGLLSAHKLPGSNSRPCRGRGPLDPVPEVQKAFAAWGWLESS